MTQQSVHIEPSKHSTDEVDELLRRSEANVDTADGSSPPAIKPNTNLDKDGKPVTDTQDKQRI